MRLDQSFVKKKVIIPWYDSETLCIFTIVLLFIFFFFGVAGISVVNQNPEYFKNLWVPVLVAAMSGSLILSITIRLIKRYTYKFPKK